jgi:uncharacterized RDD family membrane protein YckC
MLASKESMMTDVLNQPDPAAAAAEPLRPPPLDSLLQLLIITPLLIWVYGLEALTDPALDRSNFDFFSNIALMLAVLLFWRYKGATPGKMLMGLRIVDADTHGPVPFGRLVLRMLGYLLSALPLFLGFVWVAFDKRKQGFHDKIARTLVLQGN